MIIFKAAICDNDKNDLEQAEKLLFEYKNMFPEKGVEINTFLSPEKLKADLLKGKTYDVYLLDIIMPEINGIEIGKLIRAQKEGIPIIYLTSSREHAFDAYGIHAVGYLEKPVKAENMFYTLDMAYQVFLNNQEKRFAINSKEGIHTVNIKDIVYVENISRCAVYTISDGSQITGVCNRSSFEKSVEPLLGHPGFVHCHKSFFVNMWYIKLLKKDKIILDNAKIIPVSRERAASVKKTYLKYLVGKGE